MAQSTVYRHHYLQTQQYITVHHILQGSQALQVPQPPPPLGSVSPTGVKSQPTVARGGARNLNLGSQQQPSLQLQSQLSNNYKKYHQNDANIYDEPMIPSDAWKNFGRDDEDDDEEPRAKSEFSHSDGP